MPMMTLENFDIELPGQRTGRRADERIVGMGRQKITDVCLRVREEHVVDEGNRGGRPLDVEEDAAAVEHDHGAAFPLPATQAGPRQSGS